MRRKKHSQITDRNEAWWEAWKLAHTATTVYEAHGRTVDRDTALACLRGWAFPDEATLRKRLEQVAPVRSGEAVNAP